MAASHSQTLACSVPSFVVSDGPHTTYLVVTLLGERRFVVRRRFSAFLALHDELRFELPRLPRIFPAAKTLLSGLPQVKRRRVGELDSYLRLAASLAGTSLPSALLGFLGVDDLSQASAGEAQLRAVIAAGLRSRLALAIALSNALWGRAAAVWTRSAATKALPLPPVQWIGCRKQTVT